MAACPNGNGTGHWWELEPAKSRDVRGVCKQCGEVRVFAGTVTIGGRQMDIGDVNSWDIQKDPVASRAQPQGEENDS